MNAVNTGEKRDLVLNPLEQAFLQDLTRGPIKTYVGPCVINQTGQDRPVKYNHSDRTYRTCQLEEAVCKVPIASEGDYIVLENPSTKAGERPEEGTVKTAPALSVGCKINIPGPCTVPLWPGQNADVIKGHNLRSNQYLVVRIYNEDEAKQNWSRAVVKKVGDAAASEGGTPVEQADLDLGIGQLLIIKGTEVSFYIPPTGVEVVKDEAGEYVRDALTLERLTYCVLVDEDGNKRYEKGPQVVFPAPTEAFMTDPSGARKFKAIELNQIQGIHVKVIAAYEEGGKKFKEGDEVFITGSETAIYYPRQEHSIVTYGGQLKHYATALPAGEGRYVMNRNTGDVNTEKGPKMLLPDPRTEVTVRRILSDRQCDLWYPGNQEAKAYNQSLRSTADAIGASRKGMVSETEIKTAGAVMRSASAGGGGAAASPQAVMLQSFAGELPPDMYGTSQNFIASGSPIGAIGLPVGREQAKSAMLPETFSRGTVYTPPRAVTMDTKYEGVPAVTIWTGYAVMVVNKRGGRRVEQGPNTILLDYDETLEVLELSTGKPKNTDKLEKTVYLRILNNKVSDIVNVETADHVPVQIKMAYRVSFEGDPNRWFETENYVKLLCDHIRSILKGKVQRLKIEDFYRSSTDTLRNIILGEVQDGGKRPGLVFEENGMAVKDVEILGIQIDNEQIRNMLTKAQYEVVSGNITITQLEKALEVTQRREEIVRQQAEAEADTVKRRHELAVEQVTQELTVNLARIKAELDAAEGKKAAVAGQEAVEDVHHNAQLARAKASIQQDIDEKDAEVELRIKELQAEAEAVVQRFNAAQDGFSEALLTLGNQDALAKIAEALSVQKLIGGKSFADVLGGIFQGSPMQKVFEKIANRGGVMADNGESDR